MKTPIYDFVTDYARKKGQLRFHMPGHKGQTFLGPEAFDITEIDRADALYEANGIIEESEQNAAFLFGSGKTLYSTEGSSQCIRAMLYLALTCRAAGTSSTVLAVRNAHKAFLYAAALLDIEPQWLFPANSENGIHSCSLRPEELEQALCALPSPPAAVYVTSPSYLGECADLAALAEVCHRYRTLLLVDNAHGAYLHFLSPARHPLDLGADMCCDSAHKTLPVLTGGAYLQLAKHLPPCFADNAKSAMALFGSTSPSYLTLASLDLCNRYLSNDYSERLAKQISCLKAVKESLIAAGWQIADSDPLKLTLLTARSGTGGKELADYLRIHRIECEFADRDFLVLMVTPENSEDDLERLCAVLKEAPRSLPDLSQPPVCPPPQIVCSPRKALFSRQKTVPVAEATGLICGTPTVSCPPAIPIAVSGERINEEIIRVFQYYGISTVQIVDDSGTGQ